MKKLIYTLNIFCLSVLVFNPLHVRAMENDYPQLALQAEIYNNSNSLLFLPNDILGCIVSQDFSYNKDRYLALINSIKLFMELSMICRKFSRLLTFETIGSLCKNYTPRSKANALDCIAHDFNGTPRRLAVLALACAGANESCCHQHTLLEKAIIQDDVQLATMIFKHHAQLDANIKVPYKSALFFESEFFDCCQKIPLFFSAKSRSMAQLFIDNGANVHENIGDTDGTNVLWSILDNRYPSDLVKFYLKQNVDAKKLNTRYTEGLLHRFAATGYTGKFSDIANFLQKAKILLNAIPDQVNLSINTYKGTPLDVVEKSLKYAKKSKTKVAIVAFKALKGFFHESGGFTTAELNHQDFVKTYG